MKELAETAWNFLAFTVFFGLATIFIAFFTCICLYAFYQAKEEVARLRLRGEKEGWGKYLR